MYRHAGLVVACATCGVEQLSTRMALGPLGGHQCWKCQMRAQIAEHRQGPAFPVVAAGALLIVLLWVVLALR